MLCKLWLGLKNKFNLNESYGFLFILKESLKKFSLVKYHYNFIIAAKIGTLYRRYKDVDGNLYLYYTDINMFPN